MTIFATRLRRLAALSVVGALAVLAAAALAAPVRQGTVSAAAPYAWDGGPGNGSGQGTSAVRCTPVVYECEDTLVELKDAGDLVAEIKAGSGSNDLDAAIYKSDSSGTVNSDPVNGDNPNAEDVTTNKDAKVTLKKAAPGFYVIRVRFFDAIQGVYKGTASVKVATPPPAPATTPAPTTTPVPTPAPASKPAPKERRNACKKKAKKIKNAKKRKKALKRCKIH